MMKGKEREIFRDCYNLLESNNLNNFRDKAKVIVSKYSDIDDKMLCCELLGVVGNHLHRIKVE